MQIGIKGFLETSFLDWPGKLTAVLFLPGCNFKCPYCHNHLLVTQPESLETIPLEYVLRRLRRLRGWVDGVCVTGGEPTLTPNLSPLLEGIKEEGWAIKLDTNGTFPDRISELMERDLVDCVAMDIKAPLDSRSYSRCAGVSVDIPAIRRSIALLSHGEIDYTLRMTVVPALLTEEQVYQTAMQLMGVRRFLLQDFDPSDPPSPELRGGNSFGEVMLERMQARVDAILGQERDCFRQLPRTSRERSLLQVSQPIGRNL
jgi:pyruvate formate lyase activating enzyme